MGFVHCRLDLLGIHSPSKWIGIYLEYLACLWLWFQVIFKTPTSWEGITNSTLLKAAETCLRSHIPLMWNPRAPVQSPLTRSPLWAQGRRMPSAGGGAPILDVVSISVNGRQPAHQIWAHAQPLQFFQILSIRDIMWSLTATAKLAFTL